LRPVPANWGWQNSANTHGIKERAASNYRGWKIMNLLVVTTLYPNAVQRRHGIFVETRLRHLLATTDHSAVVVAPVPWFPVKLSRYPQYSSYAEVPERETINGIDVLHPRYLVIPKIGMLLTPFFMAFSLIRTLRKLKREGVLWDLVDAHYFYPDGVAVSLAKRWFNTPFLVTARGTDINLIPQHKLPRRMILRTARKAAASITVCQALKDEMVAIGAQEEKIQVLRNGVDLEKFRPLPKEVSRAQYQMSGTCLLSVGHLIERKGHHLVIDALQYLPNATLYIAGDGEQLGALQAQVCALELEERVHFLGALTQEQLAQAYSAVDVLVLASSREGWANVLLESMACGTPVVATSIWGTPEVVQTAAAGVLVEEHSGKALADGVTQLLDAYPEREDTRRYAESFSWSETVEALDALMHSVTQQGQSNGMNVSHTIQ
jgi:glycosyltransferase involved in cell wall biosynthesis